MKPAPNLFSLAPDNNAYFKNLTQPTTPAPDAFTQIFGPVKKISVTVDWKIADADGLSTNIKPTTSDALAAANQLADLAQGAVQNGLEGSGVAAANALVTTILEASGIVPTMDSESRKYRIAVYATGIAIDVVVIGATIVAAPEVAGFAATAGLVFAVSELLVRPIVGSN